MIELKTFIESLGFSPQETGVVVEKLLKYRDELLIWNKNVNMTAITNPQEFVQKHLIDSLLCVESVEFQKAKTVIDVGTGAGFPGIPLAVLFPDKQFVLLDSLQKRLKIVKELAEGIQIENLTVVHGRAEDLARESGFRETFDLCVSRAVANLSTLTELCLPFVKIGGTFIAYKGPDWESEADDAKKAIRIMGGKLNRTEKADSLELGTKHTLLYIEKVQKTPKQFPRKAGTPGKTPIQ